MKYELVDTADGSSTVLSKELNVTYHSIHGSRQESMHVFIKNGLEKFAHYKYVEILEFGFGTGLNALLSWKFALENKLYIQYTSYEKFPLENDILSRLYFGAIENETHYLSLLHQASWNENVQLDANFTLHKIQEDFLKCTFQNRFQIIYYDAFAPTAQPELWTPSLFSKLYNALVKDGFVVTYCAKGQVKRDLRAAGFTVETLAGPPGKREMIKAIK